MPDIDVRPYDSSFADAWNRLVAEARNGHFLFDRRFMEYHADRFRDASLLFFEKGRLLGMLPANRSDDTVYSHQGLTFGGVIAGDRLNASRMLSVFDALLRHLSETGVRSLVYKPVPHIYHRRPAEEDLYALFRHGAELVRRDISTTIQYGSSGGSSGPRRKAGGKPERSGVCCAESRRWEEFWALLTEVLMARHGVQPVHSLAEICLLRDRFPEAIRLFAAVSASGAVLAGVVIFETRTVAHAQYGGVSPEGRAVRALDGLYLYLIEYYRASKRWFDFGISSERDGQILIEGLARQKEEFGGSSVVYDTYRMPVS
jgi:hypothetical protein